jgi:hypothetical protein
VEVRRGVGVAVETCVFRDCDPVGHLQRPIQARRWEHSMSASVLSQYLNLSKFFYSTESFWCFGSS